MWYGHSCTRRERLGETLLRLVQQAHDPGARGHRPLCPRERRGSALARCRLPASTWRKASHATRQTSAVRRCSVLATIRVWPAESYAAMTLWLLGYPEQALARLHEALALAHELSHPYSLAFVRCWAA